MGVKPELNAEQQAATYCTENVVVAAGAGSGKTMVLASRFAWLVTEKNYRVSEILTLTFTNKAAAQMYRRIHSLLGEIAANDKGTKGKRAQEALDDFIHARIQTLDSYSSALVKQCASRYGINPNFVIDQERCHSLAQEEALPFLISKRRHPALQRLYFGKRPDDIVQKIFAAVLFEHSRIDTTGKLTFDLKKQFDIVCTEWEKQRKNIEALLMEMHEHLSQDNALFPELVPIAADFANGRIAFPKAAEIRKYFDLILTLSDTECIEAAEADPLQDVIAKLLHFLSSVIDVNLSKGRRNNNPVKEIIRQLRAPAFVEFSSLSVFCMQAGLIFSLLMLMQELQVSYLAKKRAEGILTFSDVARLARSILLEQQDIRQSEKETFKAIMIDEFQDNNELQKDLLFLLAEKVDAMNKDIPSASDLSPGKLFFVGDEKQSVYLFRGADVSVFRKLKTEMQSAELPLSTNYRSAPNLIGAFNAIFGGSAFDPEGRAQLSQMPSVFVPATNEVPLYEASYTPLRAGKTGEGKLSICIFDDNEENAEKNARNDALPPEENEAYFVAERIHQLLAEKYQPHEIALLFRTRTHQHLFEKHLRMLNIPYANEDLGSFFFGGPINDIMSVLRLAAYPLDRAAYAEMLRSPFAGLSLSGVAICLAPDEQEAPFTDESLARLSEIDQSKYLQGQKVFRLICEMAQQESVSALVSELWYALGYRYETEWNAHTSVYRELYDYLFHLAAKADANNEGLAAFADSIQELRQSSGRLNDIEIPLERPSAVQILTIHKSKGLEFPVVFLCCCDRSTMGDRSGDVYDTGGAGIAIAPPLPPRISAIPKMRNNFFWEHSNAEAKRKSIAELRRLLYVGMTRAEKELYLTGRLAITEGEKDDNGALCAIDELADFSMRVKNYVERKIEKREKTGNDKNDLPGDSIIGNDTFFDMVLPAFAAHIPSDGLTAQPSFFTMEEIPTNIDHDIKKGKSIKADFTNDQNGLNAFFEKAEKFYRNAEVISTPQLEDNHLTPTSLHSKIGAQADSGSASFSVNKEFSGEDASAIFNAVDTLLSRFSQTDDNGERFSSSSFGIIAHLCAEALLNDVEPVVPPSIACFLTQKETVSLLEAGKELAVKFLRSPLGIIAKNASLRENEFSFRTLVRNTGEKEIFVSGTIDLLFDDEETIHVVDFKTDKNEVPGVHTAQMACYYYAADAMFAASAKKKCRTWLYYLRSGHAVEVTERAAQLVIG